MQSNASSADALTAALLLQNCLSSHNGDQQLKKKAYVSGAK
jgi:hypothetical protein